MEASTEWIRLESTEVARSAQAEEAGVRQRRRRRGGKAALSLALRGRLLEHSTDPVCGRDARARVRQLVASDDVLDISPVVLVMPVTRQWWGRASR